MQAFFAAAPNSDQRLASPFLASVKAANKFKDKTTAVNQFWQTDFTSSPPSGAASMAADRRRSISGARLASRSRSRRLKTSVSSFSLPLGSATIPRVSSYFRGVIFDFWTVAPIDIPGLL